MQHSLQISEPKQAMDLCVATDAIPGTGHLFQQLTTTDANKLSSLFDQYDTVKSDLHKTASFLSSGIDTAFSYLVDGNLTSDHRHVFMAAASSLSNVENGTKALDADYWDKAIRLTDVLTTLPSNRRKEWQEQITTHTTPKFDRDAVIETLLTLITERTQFFAERVDNVFKSLSKTHVTNSPSGFTQKFIMTNLSYKSGGSYTYWSLSYDKSAIVDDLRVLVNQITGRLSKDLTHCNTNQLLNRMIDNQMFGEFVEIDGGALKIKLFKNGNAHFLVEPSIAATLNNVLSSLYPAAIPSQFRNNPKKASKEWAKPIDTSLSIEATECLLSMRHKFKDEDVSMFTSSNSEAVLKEAHEVLIALGANYLSNSRDLNFGKYYFDYDVKSVLLNVCISGRFPEKKSHQYYPTPDDLAKEAVSMLDFDESKSYLEPSAGQGALASYLPKDAMLIDISQMNCDVLRAKGFTNVVKDDFIKFSATTTSRFEGILMNPPFHKGMAKAHIIAAAGLLSENGALVAIVPSTLSNLEIDGFTVTAQPPKQVAFDGATVNVTLLYINKA